MYGYGGEKMKQSLKRDGPLFAFGIGAAILALCCMVLQVLPELKNPEIPVNKFVNCSVAAVPRL